MNQSIKTLEAHQAWRRGDDSAQGSPAEIGIAIDDCLLASKRYELLRTFNPRQFRDLCARNIKGENFDEMVDSMIEARAR